MSNHVNRESFFRSVVSAPALAAAWLLLGCAGQTPGTHPHDMSVEHHEAAATQEERAAGAHETQYDPTGAEARKRCRSQGRVGGIVCWTSVVNPTDQHMRDAAKHRKRAAEHRAAAQALRDAEATSCAGVDDDDRDISPFYHREDIARVEPLKVTSGPPRIGDTPLVKGATVVFRAVPGLTAEWLQRVVNCHVARNAVMGHEAADMPYCPLALKGVTGTVHSTGDGFAVEIRSDDPDVANEVLRRAEQLVAR